ncbi:MAG: tRNA lysidine(34) synthetase TilS, partial [Phycisphaerae bacterium]|nr:tRNA lysidine(34) synthetase TilS [Phycisphaerae bacterium]
MGEHNGQADPLTDATAAWIDAQRLLRPETGVLVGVSGGADSVALLDVLYALAARPDRRYRLTVGHLDHCLRDESPADAAFVGDLAARYGLPAICEQADVADAAARGGRSSEDAARMARYRFLTAAARRCGAAVVAVGHHADDNVETILYRICRGTHLRGLSGMPPARTLNPAVTLVRPLLTARREQIEAYCRRRQLAWRTDATNAETRYRRNAVRHELLPWIRRRLNPRADEALLRLAGAAGEVEAWAVQQAEGVLAAAIETDESDRLVLRCAGLADCSGVVRRYALRAAVERVGVPLRTVGAERLAELAAACEADGPPAVALPGGFEARR